MATTTDDPREVSCPRCAYRGARTLAPLAEERHPIFMCPFCRHTWCEAGRVYA